MDVYECCGEHGVCALGQAGGGGDFETILSSAGKELVTTARNALIFCLWYCATSCYHRD